MKYVGFHDNYEVDTVMAGQGANDATNQWLTCSRVYSLESLQNTISHIAVALIVQNTRHAHKAATCIEKNVVEIMQVIYNL